MIPFKEQIAEWILHYGSFALFALLALGIVGLPIPDETLLVVTGILLHKQKLNLPLTLLAAYTGSMFGITLSYFLGKTLGKIAIDKYGGWFGITESKLKEIQKWYHKLGKWTLFFGYFIPGVRHFTGFFAGMAHLRYKDFALFSYSGALVWASTFLLVGYYFHRYWASIFYHLETNIETLALALVLLWIFHWYFKNRTSK